jgi:hypothetical protein
VLCRRRRLRRTHTFLVTKRAGALPKRVLQVGDDVGRLGQTNWTQRTSKSETQKELIYTFHQQLVPERLSNSRRGLIDNSTHAHPSLNTFLLNLDATKCTSLLSSTTSHFSDTLQICLHSLKQINNVCDLQPRNTKCTSVLNSTAHFLFQCQTSPYPQNHQNIFYSSILSRIYHTPTSFL